MAIMSLGGFAFVADIRVLIAFVISANQNDLAAGVLAAAHFHPIQVRGLEHDDYRVV